MRETESFCADPISQRYEFNFFLPRGSAAGAARSAIALGSGTFAPMAIEVV